MTLRRRRALPQAALDAARQLQRCEAGTALLERVRPLDLPAERQRLLEAHTHGRRVAPRLDVAPLGSLRAVREKIAAAASQLDRADVEQRLLSERADELLLEAELAELAGRPGFVALAARLFPVPDEDRQLRQRARQLAAVDVDVDGDVSAGGEGTELHLSDDERDPLSLLSLTSELALAARLPVRVVVDAGLVPLAAVAEGMVRIRAGARLSAASGRRIALHEVEGHLVPRQSGIGLGGVLAVGSAGSIVDEEGRAIWLERRAGLLAPSRLAELGRRYLAAVSVREGADFWQTLELILETGAAAETAVEVAARVHRGGGLGRELIYLTGYERVTQAFGAAPRLQRVLSLGRLSLEAADELLTSSFELDDDGDVI